MENIFPSQALDLTKLSREKILLGRQVVEAADRYPHCFTGKIIAAFCPAVGLLEEKKVEGKLLGGAGPGVQGQLRSQREPWCHCLGCEKPKPLGSFIGWILYREANCVPRPVSMGMGNVPLQRQQHKGDWGKKDLRLLLFPRHSTCSSKRK